ncbi:MAG: preprotein translocase subunit YajC [candidate division KSB1 bacterium]|nr:preprotein translocase subunit YajC [candidate division KSB1 bacterium]MDZ7341836.1 preprotein translocase subunit YajC [candidate division KSB1 bacterium]
MFNFILLMGAPAGGQSGQVNPLAMWLPIILIFAIMYFLIFRPQAKKQKQHRMMLDALKKGDKIITAGGIYGTVLSVKEKENTVIVKIDDDTKIELVKSSVAQVIEKG